MISSNVRKVLCCIGNPMADIFLNLPLQAKGIIEAVTGKSNHISPRVFDDLYRKLEQIYPEDLEKAELSPGGGAVTMLAVLAGNAPAVQPMFFGAVGDDLFGEMIIRQLSSSGVSCELQKYSIPTGRMLYCSYGTGDNTDVFDIIGSPGAALQYYHTDHEVLYTADLFLEGFVSDSSGLWDHPALVDPVSYGSERRIILDLGSPGTAYRTAAAVRAASSCGSQLIVMGTEQEIKELDLHVDMAEIIKAGAVLVIKQGSRGTELRKDNIRLHAPSRYLHGPLGEIQTVGAGDAFSAGFLAGLYAGLDRTLDALMLQDALSRGAGKAADWITKRVQAVQSK